MNEFKNYYFKVEHKDPLLMSGLPLPDPAKGPYRFVDCDFHPAVHKILDKEYTDSEYIECNYTPKVSV